MSSAKNTRARSEALQAAARALIEAHGIDLRDGVPIRALADELVNSQGCTLETARRHIAKAARRMRGEISAADNWGGYRPGAGLKTSNERSKVVLNEAARKQVARVARAAAGQDARDRIARGANLDDVCVEQWEVAQAQHPDFRDWPSAQRYFETVFVNEVESAA